MLFTHFGRLLSRTKGQEPGHRKSSLRICRVEEFLFLNKVFNLQRNQPLSVMKMWKDGWWWGVAPSRAAGVGGRRSSGWQEEPGDVKRRRRRRRRSSSGSSTALPPTLLQDHLVLLLLLLFPHLKKTIPVLVAGTFWLLKYIFRWVLLSGLVSASECSIRGSSVSA